MAHPVEMRSEAVALLRGGLNDCEVSRRLGIPRSTVRDWRRPVYVPKTERVPCPRCWRPAKPTRFTPGDYSELLAMYLGDGCISEGMRTQRLRITLDKKYLQIIRDTRGLLERCFSSNRVDEVSAQGCIHLSVYYSHLSCVLPQHGPGRKHERRIILEPWQEAILETSPWPFIRGCIRTDGCVFVNRTDVHREEPYEYLSYGFSNASRDIVEVFVTCCDRVGVRTRVTAGGDRLWTVRINRRASVALMLAHVGGKR